ncbi:MAG: glycosyl transferase group 1 protein [uncultured bacterium]|nr:MAG: glycosyl transferase group 1 protein [uncultured bacterium]
MKAVIVSYIYEESGGTKKVIDDILDEYKKRGDTAHLYVINGPEDINTNYKNTNQKTYLNNRGEFSFFNTFSTLIDSLSDTNPDIIYMILGHCFGALLTAIFPSQYRKKTILYYLDPWFTFNNLKSNVRVMAKNFINLRNNFLSTNPVQVYSPFEKFRSFEKLLGDEVHFAKYYKDVMGIIVCSTDMYRFFTKELDVSEKKVLHLPLYINNNYIKKYNKDDLWLKSYKPIVMYVGRVGSSWKGFGIVLEALKELDNFSIDLYMPDETELSLSKYLFQSYGISNKRVKIYTGLSTNEILFQIPRMTAMLVPSIAEGFSFTMLESMIVGGITVVGPLYGGPKDVIKNNYNGFTFKPGDGKDLAKVLTKLLQLNDLELRVIRDNAVKTALTYSFSRYWNTLSTFFPR